MMLLAPDMVDGDAEVTRQQNRTSLLTEGFTMAAKASNVWSLIHAPSGPGRAPIPPGIEEFGGLKPLRHELPNEPIFDPNPNQPNPLAPFRSEPNSQRNRRIRTAPRTGIRHLASGISSEPPATGIWRPFAGLY
jgi:hypothetical protein